MDRRPCVCSMWSRRLASARTHTVKESRMLNIDQYVAKMWTKVEGLRFVQDYKCKGKGRVLAVELLIHESDSRPEALYNLGSGS